MKGFGYRFVVESLVLGLGRTNLYPRLLPTHDDDDDDDDDDDAKWAARICFVGPVYLQRFTRGLPDVDGSLT